MLGSNAIAGDYQRRLQAGQLADSDRVRAMVSISFFFRPRTTLIHKWYLSQLQMDMTAYVKPGTTERIGIIQDFVDPALTSWIEGLIQNVNDIPSVSTKCGYACSDHVGAPSLMHAAMQTC
jgi:leucyl aminopeptidase